LSAPEKGLRRGGGPESPRAAPRDPPTTQPAPAAGASTEPPDDVNHAAVKRNRIRFF
jgi:hypothetical protein